MFGLPTAAFGALLTLMLFHIDLNLYAMVGLIMLYAMVGLIMLRTRS